MTDICNLKVVNANSTLVVNIYYGTMVCQSLTNNTTNNAAACTFNRTAVEIQACYQELKPCINLGDC